MNQPTIVVTLLIGLRSASGDNVLRAASVTHSIASDHSCVVCGMCVAIPSDPAVYRESRDIRSVDRTAFRADLNTLVSPELRPSIDNFNRTLDSRLGKACASVSSQSAC